MQRQTIDSFEAAVAYLYEIPRFTSKHTLEDTRAHLVRMGSPDCKLKQIIHVAGTNGKGSVCAYLRSILEEAGFRTAVFTSPHLTDIRERFYADKDLISREDFLRVFLKVYDSLDWEALGRGDECHSGYHPTFFEYLFLMGMVYFAERDPDYCILETGLGGRLDATNAVERKALAVITRIGLDHVEYLGETLPEIAGEKAGIMRGGVPAVYCGDVEEVCAVFEERGRNLQSELHSVSKKDYTFHNFQNKTIDFSLHTRYYGYIGVTLHTLARYQMENAALAVGGIESLFRGGRVSAEQIRAGLENAFWPGRMEEVLPEVFVDGAHNADGIRAFLETVRGDGCEGRGQKRTLLFSVVQDKDYKSMIGQVRDSALFDRILVARMETGRAASLESLRALWGAGGGVSAAPDFYGSVRAAFEEAVSKRCGGRVYIAGSLYLVGEIKEFLRDDQF